MVGHRHEKNAFRHGGRSFYSREDTVRHRKRRIEYERRIRQMLVSDDNRSVELGNRLDEIGFEFKTVALYIWM